MNEASSKFVDQFALEKLLQEKLLRVHHSPLSSMFQAEQDTLTGLDTVHPDPSSVYTVMGENSDQVMKFPSALMTDFYPENNEVYLHIHPAQEARGNILWVHGLFDENMQNYNFMIQLLNEAGFNLFLFVLPFHYERKPASSLFSGEYYWSADLFRSQYAAKQAIFDLKAAVGVIKGWMPLPTIVAGFSMGGNVSLRYFQLDNGADGLFLINPVTRLSQLIWESPLLRSVQSDLESAGFDLQRTAAYFRWLDPVQSFDNFTSAKPMAIGCSIYDQIVTETMYQNFIGQFRFDPVISYNAGHLNILRVPKLAGDIAQYYSKLVEEAFYVK